MQKTKCGFVCVFGRPNAGKSTLINALVGEKISIVSKKVQTTRNKILGIYVYDNAQTILVDTPGLFDPKTSLEKKIVTQAKSAKGDLSLWIVDMTKPYEEPPSVVKKNKVIVVFNKVDLIGGIGSKAYSEYIVSFNKRYNTDEDETNGTSKDYLVISALNPDFSERGDINSLKAMINSNLPESPFLFDQDELTNVPLKDIASEITRETIFELLSFELPYEIYVQNEKYETLDDGSIKISQIIGVAKPSQKLIVIGKNGSMIKEIGIRSRQKIEKFLDLKVHLFLFVKVHSNWMENEHLLKELGL